VKLRGVCAKSTFNNVAFLVLLAAICLSADLARVFAHPQHARPLLHLVRLLFLDLKEQNQTIIIKPVRASCEPTRAKDIPWILCCVYVLVYG
jgi:hypothetical protein